MACIAVYCSRELFPIPVTYVYIIYGTTVLASRSTMEVTLSLILAILSVGWQGVESFSGGAPLGACNTLSPDPSGHQNAQPQTTQVPYSVDLSPFTSAGGYTPGQTYTCKAIPV